MASKVEAQEKKTATAKTAAKTPAKAAKATAPAKKTTAKAATRSKVSEGDTYSCAVCGLTVVVDECGDALVMPDMICCEQKMKKASKAKSAKK